MPSVSAKNAARWPPAGGVVSAIYGLGDPDLHPENDAASDGMLIDQRAILLPGRTAVYRNVRPSSAASFACAAR